MAVYIGIDPGISGGLAILYDDFAKASVVAYAKTTPHDLAELLKGVKVTKAYLEQVHSMPAQGVVSVFKFGTNYGFWLGFLTAMGIPYEQVTPLKWQTAMSCRTGGNKNISKARAQELFPQLKITHATADALLIAEYGRRKEKGVSKNGVFYEEG